MTVRPMGAQLSQADGEGKGQTDRQDEANSRCSQFANVPKNS